MNAWPIRRASHVHSGAAAIYVDGCVLNCEASIFCDAETRQVRRQSASDVYSKELCRETLEAWHGVTAITAGLGMMSTSDSTVSSNPLPFEIWRNIIRFAFHVDE